MSAPMLLGMKPCLTRQLEAHGNSIRQHDNDENDQDTPTHPPTHPPTHTHTHTDTHSLSLSHTHSPSGETRIPFQNVCPGSPDFELTEYAVTCLCSVIESKVFAKGITPCLSGAQALQRMKPFRRCFRTNAPATDQLLSFGSPE